jgi:hypothetical protein
VQEFVAEAVENVTEATSQLFTEQSSAVTLFGGETVVIPAVVPVLMLVVAEHSSDVDVADVP